MFIWIQTAEISTEGIIGREEKIWIKNYHNTPRSKYNIVNLYNEEMTDMSNSIKREAWNNGTIK